MRRKNMTKGLTVLLLLAILAVAIVILVKVNRKKSNNSDQKMGITDPCYPISVYSGQCSAWANQGFPDKGNDYYCDDDGSCIPNNTLAKDCCACSYPKMFPNQCK